MPALARPATAAPEDDAPQEVYVADITGWLPKADVASLEHPLFALKAGDCRIREYKSPDGSVTVRVIPNTHIGAATTHDKDLWIYCISQLVAAINQGRKDINRTVRFRVHSFLVDTRRASKSTMGKHVYDLVGDALSRLHGTVVETNIRTAGIRELRGFGLIETYSIIQREESGKMIAVEVTLPEWLYRSVQARKVLTLSREYFSLKKPLHRRIYELARKHCGKQTRWQIALDNFHVKSGSTGPLKKFRAAIRALAKAKSLPDYDLVHDEQTDLVTVYPRTTAGRKQRLADVLSGRRGSGVSRPPRAQPSQGPADLVSQGPEPL